jgi:type I restriction enzyme S subunit
MTLGEIAEIRSGWGFPNAYQGRTEGIYPFYKVSDMNLVGNETVMSTANNFIDEAMAKKLGVTPAPSGTVIFPKIGAAVATNKKRLLSMPSAYDNNVMGLIPSDQINSRFLFFWMQTIDLSTLAHDSGAVPSIRKSEMEILQVPVPLLEEQARIVAILDKFDALVNDLSSGLPAEIKARRQQYEHYRDKLLNFTELQTDIKGATHDP